MYQSCVTLANIQIVGFVSFNEVLFRRQYPVSYKALGFPKESSLTQKIQLETEQVK